MGFIQTTASHPFAKQLLDVDLVLLSRSYEMWAHWAGWMSESFIYVGRSLQELEEGLMIRSLKIH